jgi:hypothetical protein
LALQFFFTICFLAKMNRATVLLLCPTLLLADDLHPGHEHHDHEHPAQLPGSPHHPHLDLEEESGDWFHFHPHLNAAIAVGGSTSEKNLKLVAKLTSRSTTDSTCKASSSVR